MRRKLGFPRLDGISPNFGEGASFMKDCEEGVLKGGETQLLLNNVGFYVCFPRFLLI